MSSRLLSTCIASVVLGAIASPLLKFMGSDPYGSTMLTVLLITALNVGALLADLFPRKE